MLIIEGHSRISLFRITLHDTNQVFVGSYGKVGHGRTPFGHSDIGEHCYNLLFDGLRVDITGDDDSLRIGAVPLMIEVAQLL